MKKALFFISAAAFLLSVFSCARFYPYLAEEGFVRPLPAGLVMRNDDYGEGHFGAKRSGGRRHAGVDYEAPAGTPVLAAKSGFVEEAGYRKGNGKYVVIRHLWGFKTYYCHLSEISAMKGRIVRRAEVIGRVGKSGNANIKGIKPHLHFELRKNGVPMDPAMFGLK